MPEYSKEELQELYDQLPEDLQKAVFSKKIGQDVQDICNENDVADNDIIFNVVKSIGHTLLGLLPPDDFLSVLEKDLKIDKEKARKINSDISKLVFIPIKKSLEMLYQIKIAEKKKLRKKDKYREVIK